MDHILCAWSTELRKTSSVPPNKAYTLSFSTWSSLPISTLILILSFHMNSLKLNFYCTFMQNNEYSMLNASVSTNRSSYQWKLHLGVNISSKEVCNIQELRLKIILKKKTNGPTEAWDWKCTRVPPSFRQRRLLKVRVCPGTISKQSPGLVQAFVHTQGVPGSSMPTHRIISTSKALYSSNLATAHLLAVWWMLL